MEPYEKGNENDSKKFEENKKKYKMALLYIQTREIKRLTKSDINTLPKKYYLVNREWLDAYKKNNNYNYAVKMLNSFNDWDNYSHFHKKILKYFTFEKGKNNIVDDDIKYNISSNKENIDSYLNFPKNCELVKEDYFKNCLIFTQGLHLYDTWIGNNIIIINDSKNNKIIYICNLVEDEENTYNSLIQVNYVLVFENEKFAENELKVILSLRNINNYFIQRKIDINKKGKQILIDQNENKYGILYFVKNDIKQIAVGKNISQENNFQNINNIRDNNNISNINQNNNKIIEKQSSDQQNQQLDQTNNNYNNINNNNINNNNNDIKMDSNNQMNIDDMKEANNSNQNFTRIFMNNFNPSYLNTNNQSQTNFNNFYNLANINNNGFNDMNYYFSNFNNYNNNYINFHHLQDLNSNNNQNYNNIFNNNNLVNNNMNNNMISNNLNNNMNNNNYMNNNMNNEMYNNNLNNYFNHNNMNNSNMNNNEMNF